MWCVPPFIAMVILMFVKMGFVAYFIKKKKKTSQHMRFCWIGCILCSVAPPKSLQLVFTCWGTITWKCHDTEITIWFLRGKYINVWLWFNQTYQEFRFNGLVSPVSGTYWKVKSGLTDHMAKTIVGCCSRFMTLLLCCQLFAQSVRSSTVYQQEGSTQRDHRWLFEDAATITDHKHQLYGTMNQLNGCRPLTPRYQTKPNS